MSVIGDIVMSGLRAVGSRLVPPDSSNVRFACRGASRWAISLMAVGGFFGCSEAEEATKRADVVVDAAFSVWLEGAGTRPVNAFARADGTFEVDRNIALVVFAAEDARDELELLVDGELVANATGRLVHTLVLPAGGALVEVRERATSEGTWRHEFFLSAPDPILRLGPVPDLPMPLGQRAMFEPKCATLLDDSAYAYVGGEVEYVFEFVDEQPSPTEYPGWYSFERLVRVSARCTDTTSGANNTIERVLTVDVVDSANATIGGEDVVNAIAGEWLTVDCAAFDRDGGPVAYTGRLRSSLPSNSTAIEFDGMRVRVLRPQMLVVSCKEEPDQRSGLVEIEVVPDRSSAQLVSRGLQDLDSISVDERLTVVGYTVDAFNNELPGASRSIVEIVRLEGERELPIEPGEWTIAVPPDELIELLPDAHDMTPHRVGRYRVRLVPSEPFDGRMLPPSETYEFDTVEP